MNLASTGLTDLSVLANAPNVSVLDISRNAISDFSPLASLDSLFELRADRMEIPLQSLGQLPAVPTLRNLWLWGNEIDVLLDTQNPWVTFHYLASNPVTCEVQNEFLAQYPNAGIYDADNTCFNGRLLERPSQALDGYMFDSPNRERAVYYYALDDFPWAFPFALSDEGYQLGTLGGFCSSTFTIENENGGRQFFRYGSDANECEPGWDLQAVKAAMTAGGERLRIFGANTWQWTFDHPTSRDSAVIFDYFGADNESSTTGIFTAADVEIQADHLRLVRPTPGSGVVDYGNGNNCVVFGGDDTGKGLAGLAPQLLAGPPVGDEGRLKVFFSDLITGGETQVFERRDVTEDAIFVCSDTPTGVREISGVVLDGRGGKLPFDLTVEITEERVSGGDAEWLTDTPDTGTWEQLGASIEDIEADSLFYRTADIDAEGDSILVYYSGQNGVAPATARVFDFIGGSWVQRGETITSLEDGGQSADGGDLSGDGNVVAMTSGTDRGDRITVYAWDSGSSQWLQRGNIITDAQAASDFLGEDIDLDFNGNNIAFTRRAAEGYQGGNTVMQYDSTSNSWLLRGQVIRETEGRDLQNIHLSEDGNSFASGNCWVAGVRGDHKLKVFGWNSSTEEWTQRGRTFAETDRQGCQASISSDGNTLAINYATDDTAGADAGAIEVYRWDDTQSDWILAGEPILGELANEQLNGAISGNGNTVAAAVGASPARLGYSGGMMLLTLG